MVKIFMNYQLLHNSSADLVSLYCTERLFNQNVRAKIEDDLRDRRKALHTDTERFIDTLYQGCVQDGPPVFLTLTAIHPEGQHPTPSRHVPLGNKRALELAVQRL